MARVFLQKQGTMAPRQALHVTGTCNGREEAWHRVHPPAYGITGVKGEVNTRACRVAGTQAGTHHPGTQLLQNGTQAGLP